MLLSTPLRSGRIYDMLSFFAGRRNSAICASLLLLALFSLSSSNAWRTSVEARNHNKNPVGEPIRRRELTDQVRFDKYSLFIKDQRIFLHSGEFHTFRLPVPSLWPDILQKAKAAGLNAISVYTHMGLLNPSPGVVDFDGFRALQPLFDAAMDAGLFVVLRPGPYINAETTAGGIAHWATSEVTGELRTNDPSWRAAWQDYIQGIINETVPNQITENGPVIMVQVDNEFSQNVDSHAEYFTQLEDVYHASPIVLPLTYNDAGMGRNFVNGTGAPDLYGMDAYPQHSFDCSRTELRPVDTTYRTYHESVDSTRPFYIPEYQGGAADFWGPGAPGYHTCFDLTGVGFQSVFNLHLLSSNAKMISYYMLFGGTSWGALPYHGGYTSYDYGAAIQENRGLTAKYDELKREGLFLRSSPEFTKTDWIGDSSSGGVTVSTSLAFATLLKNPDTNARFYVVRQANSTSLYVKSVIFIAPLPSSLFVFSDTIDLKLNVTTSVGDFQVPHVASSINLHGLQSKLVVADYAFGSSRLLYSTAQVFFAGVIDGRDVLLVFGDASQEHELSLPTKGTSRIRSQTSTVKFTPFASGRTTISFLQTKGMHTVWDSDEQLIIFTDTDTVSTFWAPTIALKSTDPFKNFWQFGTNSTILVGGPALVRSASISGQRLALQGDLNGTTMLNVIAPHNVKAITWNGRPVSINAHLSSGLSFRGGFVASLEPRAPQITIPKLSNWKFADSLPEIRTGFSDVQWVEANHTTTNIPYKPYYGDGRVLYGCDYGFCENIVLWRGHFNATGQEKSVNLSINGGEAFAASVWLNDIFLHTSFGNSSNARNRLEETDDKFIFPPGSLRPGKDNVITIVQVGVPLLLTYDLLIRFHQDNTGLNETANPDTNPTKGPRGVRGFKLDVGEFGEWRVQGKVGGYTGFVDRVRGVMNEGGLFGERQGWHLPGFDTSRWILRDLSSGLPRSAAGVGFFVTTVNLNIPQGTEAYLSFAFEEPLGQPYRALLFINGWMMGKRVGNLGPQSKFPVHEGILNYRGENTIAVALWAMEPNVRISPELHLRLDGVLEGGVGSVSMNNPHWSQRT
ncbi:hypothetical protein ONZ45_g4873 [Pleurotus djamor]|nr:hypothetical protein ONZ45_g4873 [Pleurotus djamor]